jgi:hypothetical protein
MKIVIAVLALSCLGVVNAQNVTIPDAVFKSHLLAQADINTNGDSEIQVSEAIAFNDTLYCNGINANSLVGIEEFTNLLALYCGNNSLTSLSLPNQPQLTRLSSGFCSLTSLDISGCPALSLLYLTLNPLTSLNVSNCPVLSDLHLDECNLSSFDLSQNPLLYKMNAMNNNFNSLNIFANTALNSLNLHGNNLITLDITNNLALTSLDCSINNMSSLTIGDNTQLEFLNVAVNSLSGTMSLAHLTSLKSFDAYDNDLNTVNIANGNNAQFINFRTEMNPNLSCVSVDDVPYSVTNWTYVDNASVYNYSCTLSIDEIDESNVIIAPNPIDNELLIMLDDVEGIQTVAVVNTLGQVVKTASANAQMSIDMSSFEPGIYFVNFISDTGQRLLVSKVVKRG